MGNAKKISRFNRSTRRLPFQAFGEAATCVAFGQTRHIGATGFGALAVSLSLGVATPAWADTTFGSTYAVNPTGIMCTRDEAGGSTEWTCLVPDANGGFAIVSGLPSTATGEPDYTAVDAHADANTGVDAVLFGNVESSAQGSQAVAVGAGAQATGHQATAVGNEAIASQNSAVAVGGTSSALGSLRSTEASGMGATAIGAGSVATNAGAVAIGDSATASGAYSSALGTGARATDHAGLAFGNNAWARAFDTAIGSGALQNSMESGNAVAIGANAGASAANATESVLIGFNAGVSINGNRNVGTGYAALAATDGSLNTASGNYALAMVTGNNNLGMGTGAGAVVTGDNNVSIGNMAGTLATVDTDGNPTGATPSSFSDAVNIGNRASGLTDGAVAIGSEATVSVENSVALGSNSVADGATLGDGAYSPTGDLADISGIAPVGEVSLGSAGNERRISNVAAGSADTDAVNVSQLKALSDIANAGWNATDADGNSVNIGPNGDVTYVGDANIRVAQTGSDDDGRIEISLNKDINLGPGGSVTIGGSLLDTSGLAVTNGTTTTVVGAAGVTSGNIVLSGVTNDVTGLANTTLTDPSFATAGRAATEEQLALVNAAANAGWTISAEGADATNVAPGEAVDLNNSDGNIIVSKDVASNDVTFDLADNIEVDSVMLGDVTLDTDGLTIAGGPSVTVTGIDAGDRVITNVAAGVNPTDAVNVSQLNSVIGDVNIGFAGNSGGTILRNSGQVVTIQGTATTDGTYSGVNIRTSTDPATGAVNIEMAESPRFGNVVVNDGGTGRITGVADGALSATSNDAVNGSQIVALGDSIAATLSNGSSYDPATNSVNTQIVVGGTVYTTVEAAIQAVNTSVNGGWSVTTGSIGSGVATNSSVAQVAPGATAQFTAGNNVVITQNGTEVQVAVNPNLSGVESISIVDGPTIDRAGIDMTGQRITNLGAGVALTDAVNLGQLTGGMANTLSSAMSYTDQQIAGMRIDLADLRRDANGSTAAAMALAQVPQAFEPGMGIMGLGVSHWQGEQAIAVGVSKASDNGRIVIRASGTYNTRGRAGAAVGAGVQF